MSDYSILLECVGCKARREYRPGECAPDDCPMCDKCFMPMVVLRAKVKLGKRQSVSGKDGDAKG